MSSSPVPKRRRIFAAAVCLLTAAVLVFALAHDREPHHGGYALSQWLAFLTERSKDDPDYPSASQMRAQQAIRTLGTNASPLLLKWIRHETPFWRTHLPASIKVHLPRFIQVDKAQARATGALEALKVLGPAAGDVIPELSKLMTDTQAWETADRATGALAYMGTNALSPLLQALTKPSLLCRPHIADAVGHLLAMHPEATSAVPVLVRCLTDADPVVTYAAAGALGNPKLPQSLIIPPLTAALRSSDPALRWNAAYALGQCRGAAATVAPFLKQVLNDPDPDVANIAAQSLQAIAPEGVTNAATQ